MSGNIPTTAVCPALLAIGQAPTDKELNNLIDFIDNEGKYVPVAGLRTFQVSS